MEIRDQPPCSDTASQAVLPAATGLDRTTSLAAALLAPAGAMSYAGLLEKIEILRSRLRWAPRLERADIERLLTQAGSLRDDVLQLSHRERFLSAAQASAMPAGGDDAAGPGAAAPADLPAGARRQALLARRFVFEGTFGDNPRLLEALEIAEKAAPTRLPVLIDGESGTGKELMAKVIHANGSRSTRPLISVNCGAIPENLIESELFGHRKGAFTGAATDRKGKFESAHGGTIFLDEIGELPLQGQVKLLRVLESQEIQRVGADEPMQVDVRIVAATNRNLRQMAQQGSFREDLFYRLDVIRVTLPPLRERRDEIALLLAYFGDEAAEALGRRPVALTPALRRFLLEYAYPGNIRELRNLVYRIGCLADGVADLRHLPPDLREAAAAWPVVAPTPTTSGSASAALPTSGSAPPATSASPATSPATSPSPSTMPTQPAPQPRSVGEARRLAGDAAERAFLEQGLREAGGTVAELARRCAMNRSHLQALLKKHGLQARDYRAAASNRMATG
jgi:transcriptional regulator with GAF, ATPase, and Fis domain